LQAEHVELSKELLGSQDGVVIITDHECFDWEIVREYSSLIVDMRGVFSVEKGKIYRA